MWSSSHSPVYSESQNHSGTGTAIPNGPITTLKIQETNGERPTANATRGHSEGHAGVPWWAVPMARLC